MAQAETNKPAGRKLTTQRLNEMAFSFRNAGTLIAACELGLFTKISEGPDEPAVIAEKIGIPAESVERLMIACASLGLLEKKGDKYVNAPDVERYLVKGRRTYFGDYLAYQPKVDFDRWKDIASYLRLPAEELPERCTYSQRDDLEATRRSVASQHNSSVSAAYKLAREFDFSPYSLFLDLGGGAGHYSIAAAQRYPQLRAIVFDFPNIVTIAEEYIAEAGVSDRVKTHRGNFIEDELPRGADLVSFIGGPLLGYSVEQVQFLFNKVFDAVEPGGGIMIIDYMLNEDKTGPLDSAMRHLNGLSQRSQARINSGPEFCEYLRKAGFVDMEVTEFIPGSLGRVIGKKPR
jgi:hypothetical protein